MPEVSVVIPAYNAASTILDTLTSLLAQTFPDFEAIVVDDGSRDGTAKVVAGFSDPRVRVHSIANSGVANARNVGIGLARGELIALLDADDLWLPTKLERQVQRIHTDASIGMCVTAATRIDGHGNELGAMPLAHAQDNCAALLLKSMVIGCTSSGLFRSTVLADVGGFDRKFSQCADWDLWLRVSAVSEVALIDDPLVLYRTAPGNMSSNIELLERDTFAVLDDFFEGPHGRAYAALRTRAYATHWMTCAGSYLHAGNPRAAVRCLLEGLRTDPRTVTRPLGLPARRIHRLVSRQARRR